MQFVELEHREIGREMVTGLLDRLNDLLISQIFAEWKKKGQNNKQDLIYYGEKQISPGIFLVLSELGPRILLWRIKRFPNRYYFQILKNS